jgi:hypothetical protein
MARVTDLESSLEVDSNSVDDDNLFDFLSAVLYLTSLGAGLRDGNRRTLLMLEVYTLFGL